MSEKDRPEAAQRLTEAFGEPYRRVMQNAVDAQQRNVQLAQGWVESLTGVLESQAEATRALTRAMESYVNVVEEALRSQERTNRALAESLDAYRDVAERAATLQEKSTDLRESMQNSQALAKSLMDGSEMQMEAFQKMLAEAMDTYMNLLNAPLSLYQKNLEALRRQGE
jgi:septation ring formation regulator EzrA